MEIQLRSGKEVSNNSRAENKEKTDQEEDKANGREDEKSMSRRTTKEEKQKQIEQPKKSCGQKQKEKEQAYTPAVPFPQRLQKAKKEEQFSKFLENFQENRNKHSLCRGNQSNAKLCKNFEEDTEQEEEDC